MSCLFRYSSVPSDKRVILLLCLSLAFVLTSDLLPDLHSCGASPSHCDAGILRIVSTGQGHLSICPFVHPLNQGNAPDFSTTQSRKNLFCVCMCENAKVCNVNVCFICCCRYFQLHSYDNKDTSPYSGGVVADSVGVPVQAPCGQHLEGVPGPPPSTTEVPLSKVPNPQMFL